MTGTHPEEQPKQPNRVNLIAIIAGALASISAAVVASFFGVAGTLIGTAVVSIVSSLGAALYAGLLGRTQGLTKGFVQRTATTVQTPTGRSEHGEAPTSTGAPGDQQPPAGRGRGILAGLRWRRSALVIVGVAMLIFALAIGAVTGIEAAIKEPIASALGVRARGQASTSIGVAVDRASGSATTRRSSPPSSSTRPEAPTSQPGQAPATTQPNRPGPSTTAGSAPSTTLPPTTAQPSSPSTSGAP